MIEGTYNWWSEETYGCLCPPDQIANETTFEKAFGYVQSILTLPILLAVGVAIVPIEACRRTYTWITDEIPTGFAAVSENSALWDTVNLANARFSNETHFGIATSHYQYGGAEIYPDSQWNEPLYPAEPAVDPAQTLQELTRGGIDLLGSREQVERVINTLQEMELNSFRLSVPESLWPDQNNTINEPEYARFREILEQFKDAGIRVVLTCHHFSHPKEMENSGSFFNETNCDRFVDFCSHLYDHFGDVVDEWCTINEPGVFTTSAYMRGVFPPCEVNFEKMGRLMIQMIKMHNRAYCALNEKAGAAGRDVVVGFSHQQITFKAEHWWNPITQAVASIMTHIMSNAYLEFYRSGTFHIQIPFLLNMKYEDPEFAANNGYLDVIQLQCYTRPLITTWPIDSGCYPHEIMTNMPYRMDPAALYEGMKHVYEVTNKEIDITEFGMATHDPRLKRLYMQRALYAMYEANREGVPLSGVHAWSFLGGDARYYHEWDQDPVLQDFGICEPTEKGDHYPLRPAAEALRDVVQRTRAVAAAA